ncbi:hypothetical protein V6N12_039957 [Hibiscus sabdariffa]|uniref:Uncharacterized protein n=1 Tax=Hibiscus sabdariffa TaxID=183260 RepID=A0ABR2E292_9ROSI
MCIDRRQTESDDIVYSLEHKMLDEEFRGQEAVDTALKADLVVLNTAVAGKWLDTVLKEHVPDVLPKVLMSCILSVHRIDNGGNGIHGKLVGGHAKLVSLTGTPDYVYPPTQVDYSKSISLIPLHYAEPYFGGVATTAYGSQAMSLIPLHYAEPYFGGVATTAYGPQAMGKSFSQQIHQAHMMAMLPTRVPLPLDLKEDEPIYVSAKQYHAILRGSGGQFLNTKKLQQSESIPTNPGPDMSRSPQLHLSANISEKEFHPRGNFKDAASATSGSDVTSASNSDEMFQQQDFRQDSRSSLMPMKYTAALFSWEVILGSV